jgi:hypothetical protein
MAEPGAFADEFRFPSLAELVEEFAAFADGDAGDEGGLVESIRLELPVELWVEPGADGRVEVGITAPTQRTETSYLPVFHRFTLTLERTGGE